MNREMPIGVFDSGIGGLSVLQEIRRVLPAENLIYVADSGHAPYGDKSQGYIETRAMEICRFLLQQQVKAIVVACNTATSAAITSLRSQFVMPIVGMEPAVKPAVAISKTKVIGVLATSRTLASPNFVHLFARYQSEARIFGQPCPGLVEQVESGNWYSEQTVYLLSKFLRPLLAQGADTIVLGCTHYPFLRVLIERIAGPSVTVIDSAAAVARQLMRRLAAHDLLVNSVNTSPGSDKFWTSGDCGKVQQLISQLWHERVEINRLRMPASV